MTINIRNRVLGKYSSNFEKILAFIGLVAMATLLFIDNKLALNPGVYVYKVEWLTYLLLYGWVASSVLLKIFVLLGKKHSLISIFPFITFGLLTLMVGALVTIITPATFDPMYNAIAIVAFISIVLTDAIIFVESFDKT